MIPAATCPGPEHCDLPGCRRDGCRRHMLGLFTTLSPEQQKAALDYRGSDDWHGVGEAIADRYPVTLTVLADVVCRLGWTKGCPYMSCERARCCMAPTPANDNEPLPVA